MSDRTVEDVKGAEEQVLYQLKTDKVLICDKAVELKPLPVKIAKKLSSILNKVVREFNRIGNLEAKDRDATALGGQDELIADSFVDCVALLADHYRLGINRDDIENTMSIKQIRDVVTHQATLNEEDDFLLLPLRLVSQVLSQTTKVVGNIGNQTSTPPSPSSGESVH